MNSTLKKTAEKIFLAAIFISPIFFFTNVTRNPYLIQERILQLFICISVLLLSISLYKRKEVVLGKTFLDRPLWSFFWIAAISIIFAGIRYYDYRWSISGFSTRRMLMFIFCGLIPYYYIASGEKKLLKNIENVMIASGSVSSLYAVMQFLHIDFIWPRAIDPYGQRSISTFGNPTFLSSYLLVIIFWTIGKLFQKKRIDLLWIIILLLNLAGLGITMTRSTFLGLFIGVIILSYIIYKSRAKSNRLSKQIKSFIIFMFGSIIFLGLMLSYISPQFSKRIESFFSVEKMGSALTQRLLIWESSYNMFADTPVIGRGWGNFEIFYPFYQGELLHKKQYRNLRTHANNSHNFILELLTGVGVIGAGIYFWLIAVFIYMSAKIYKRTNEEEKIKVLIYSIAGVSFWIDNILNVSLFFPMPALAFWLNAGLLAAEGRKAYNYPTVRINLGKFYWLFIIGVLIAIIQVFTFNYKYFMSATHFFRGFKLSRQNKMPEARDELIKCYNIYKLNVDNNYELGNVYARLNKNDNLLLSKSIQVYKTAIIANPGYDEIYFNLGVMFLRSGKVEEAVRNLNISRKINPTNIDTYKSLGDIMGKQKNYKEAIELYNKALELKSDDAGLWNNYGYYNEQIGNLKKAQESYLRSLEISPKFKSASVNIMRAKNKFQRTIPVDKINNLFSVADKYIKKEEWPSALKNVLEIIEIDPVNLKAILYAGNINFKLGKKDKAIDCYKTILAINPDNKVAATNLNIISKAKVKND